MSAGPLAALTAIENSVALQVSHGIAQLNSIEPHARLMVTYRNDAELNRHQPNNTKPASLLRAAAFAMAAHESGTEVVFADDYYGQDQ